MEKQKTMKKLLLLLVMVLAFNLSNAQLITYDEISTATKRPSGTFTEYVTSIKDTIRIGEIVKFGNPSNANNSFVYVYDHMPLTSPTLAGIRAQGWESEVLKIKVHGSKRKGVSAFITGKTETGMTRYVFDYEKALSVDEVVTDTLTREQAISKLKESNDLLDLGLLSQENYDKIKEELTPIIMNN